MALANQALRKSLKKDQVSCKNMFISIYSYEERIFSTFLSPELHSYWNFVFQADLTKRFYSEKFDASTSSSIEEVYAIEVEFTAEVFASTKKERRFMSRNRRLV